MKHFKITYKKRGYESLLTGGIRELNGIAWFVENAPSNYKFVSCDVCNLNEYKKLQDLSLIFSKGLEIKG